jgi:hypothetical protein
MSLHCSPEVIQISRHSISDRTRSMSFVIKSAVSVFYPDVLIKVSLPHVSHLSAFWHFVIHWVLGKYDGFGVDVQYRCFFVIIDDSSDCSRLNSFAEKIAASVVESDVVFCSQLIQDCTSANIAITPVTERLVKSCEVSITKNV